MAIRARGNHQGRARDADAGRPHVDASPRDRIAEWLGILCDPSAGYVELRAIGVTRQADPHPHIETAYFDPASGLEKMADAARRLSKRSKGVYFTLNPVHPDAYLSPACKAASDKDIIVRRWMLVDCDPERPADVSATDAEKDRSLTLAKRIRDHLRLAGWPDPILADSGNGHHLLYRIDRPADDGGLVRRCLAALAQKFDDTYVKVDRKVFNPSRICKLYGTLARKGVTTPDRPHRASAILSVPARLDVVPLEWLEALAHEADPEPALEPAPTPTSPPAGSAAPTPSDPTTRATGGVARRKGRLKARTPADVTDTLSRARAYLKTCDPAVSGQGGHAAAFKAACAVGPGFDLTPDDALALMREIYNPTCSPPWSDHELLHKVSEAYKVESRRGWLADVALGRQATNGHVTDPTAEPAPWDAPALDSLAAHEDFPVEVLPYPLARFVKEGAACLACPPDFLATAVLAIAGAAIGRSLAVKIKDSWAESPALYAAFIGKPGSTKSPALALACRPLWEITEEQIRQYQIDLDEADKGDPKPVLGRIVVGDATCEALAPVLRENPRGVIMARDELSAWVAALNQYKSGGKGSDRQFFLSAWSGAPVIVDRKGQGDKGPIHIPHPFLAIIGAMTPDMLGSLVEGEGRDDGFLDRLLFSYPEPVSVRWQPDEIDPDLLNGWSTVVLRLFARPMVRHPDTGRERPFFVRFTERALHAWAGWYDTHNAETEHSDFPPGLDGAWAKMRAYCARLALVLDQLDWACDPTNDSTALPRDVDRSSVEAAIQLIDYFKLQCKQVRVHLRGGQDNENARAILGWLTRRNPHTHPMVSERDIRNNFPGRFSEDESALADALRWLCRRHCLRPSPPPETRSRVGRPPSPKYEINPRLYVAEGGDDVPF